MSTQIQIN